LPWLNRIRSTLSGAPTDFPPPLSKTEALLILELAMVTAVVIAVAYLIATI
jgi:hypothetical protein